MAKAEPLKYRQCDICFQKMLVKCTSRQWLQHKQRMLQAHLDIYLQTPVIELFFYVQVLLPSAPELQYF